MFQYIAFYKPFEVLSQFTADDKHRSLAEFGLPKGVYPAGRLDYDSEGLLLLTNDGRFIKKWLNPQYGHERVYYAQVEGKPTIKDMDILSRGVYIGDYLTKPCKASLLEKEPDFPERNPPVRFRKTVPTTWISLTLTEGKNRQVRKMTAKAGFPTLRLVRIALGKLTLDGLMPGQWRFVEKKDVL